MIPQNPNDKDTKKRIKQKQSTEEEYELSRFKPALRTIIEVSSTSNLLPPQINVPAGQ